MRKEPYDIPNILQSIANRVDSKEMTIHEAEVELHLSGWVNYVDEERTKELIANYRRNKE